MADEEVEKCPYCSEPVDYCQGGHGPCITCEVWVSNDLLDDEGVCEDCWQEAKAARECPLCGREMCSGYCQEFPR